MQQQAVLLLLGLDFYPLSNFTGSGVAEQQLLQNGPILLLSVLAVPWIFVEDVDIAALRCDVCNVASAFTISFCSYNYE